MENWWNNFIQNTDWRLLIAFILGQLINVILSTLKSVLTVKGTKVSATLINTISYTINASIISVIGKVDDIIIVCIITAVSNMVGVYFSLWLIEKLRKDREWRISATVKTEFFNMLIKELHDSNIEFITFNTSWPKRTPLDVFSTSKKESKKISEIFKKYNVKYTISINDGILR